MHNHMSLSRKLALLILQGKASLASVVELLAKYKMLSLLPSVQKALVQMSSLLQTKDTIMIESPFPLSDAAINHIQKIIGDEHADYKVSINSHVLAGFKARFKGILYDGSAERIIKQIINH